MATTAAKTEPETTFLNPLGQVREENLVGMFANEDFISMIENDLEFNDFTQAKDEAFEWNDTQGQKEFVCRMRRLLRRQ